MHDLKDWLFALAILVVGVAAIVWVARNGRKVRGAVGLGAILLGFGAVMDPPKRHMLEAADQKKASPENDEPKEPNEPI
jgi:hypothetical protein